ncbi:hypothetical protein HK405_004773, partial [Cladochytrium tenue]
MSQARIDSARRNQSSAATVDSLTVFARGTFKIVYKGTFTEGSRRGQPCVVKHFRDRAVYESAFFDVEMVVIRKAMDILERFNGEGLINKMVYLNEPQIWEYQTTAGSRFGGQKAMVEPFIENFEKFNSNSGWQNRDGTAWSQVMQALSHFSYYMTGGSLVLCDLQGGIYSDGVVLTDPVIMSRYADYGPADLGLDGILSFFASHQCGQYCSRGWMRPRDARQIVNMTQGTTMVDSLRTKAAWEETKEGETAEADSAGSAPPDLLRADNLEAVRYANIGRVREQVPDQRAVALASHLCDDLINPFINVTNLPVTTSATTAPAASAAAAAVAWCSDDDSVAYPTSATAVAFGAISNSRMF